MRQWLIGRDSEESDKKLGFQTLEAKENSSSLDAVGKAECKDESEAIYHVCIASGLHDEVETGHSIISSGVSSRSHGIDNERNDCEDDVKTTPVLDAIQSTNSTDARVSSFIGAAKANDALKIGDDVPPLLVFYSPSKHASKSTSVPSSISIQKRNVVDVSSVAVLKDSPTVPSLYLDSALNSEFFLNSFLI